MFLGPQTAAATWRVLVVFFLVLQSSCYFPLFFRSLALSGIVHQLVLYWPPIAPRSLRRGTTLLFFYPPLRFVFLPSFVLSLSYNVYVVPIVCRNQYDDMALHCLICLLHNKMQHL